MSVTLPRDTTPPAKPIISVIEVGTTQVKLAWSSIDDGPFVFYSIFLNGAPISQGNSSTSGTVTLLEPDTSIYLRGGGSRQWYQLVGAQ